MMLNNLNVAGFTKSCMVLFSGNHTHVRIMRFFDDDKFYFLNHARCLWFGAKIAMIIFPYTLYFSFKILFYVQFYFLIPVMHLFYIQWLCCADYSFENILKSFWGIVFIWNKYSKMLNIIMLFASWNVFNCSLFIFFI